MIIWAFIRAFFLSAITQSMLEGFCPKCGTHRIGYALRIPQYQTCPKCGAGLEITENGRRIGTGFSPFTADGRLSKSPHEAPKSNGHITERNDEDKGIE